VSICFEISVLPAPMGRNGKVRGFFVLIKHDRDGLVQTRMKSGPANHICEVHFFSSKRPTGFEPGNRLFRAPI
jgi:hypothetical protein